MEFHQLIMQKLHSLFTEHRWRISEQSENIMRYESNELVISLIYNSRENSCGLWIGKKNSTNVEVDNHVMRAYFNSDLKLSNLTKEIFANNVFQFFKTEGEELLNGKESDLNSLEKFNEQRSEEYTKSFSDSQNLEAANKAWVVGNYLAVIEYLEKIQVDNLSESYRQKYKIARQRLRE